LQLRKDTEEFLWNKLAKPTSYTSEKKYDNWGLNTADFFPNGFKTPYSIHELTKKAVVWFGRQPLFP
jgi:hypothetical protein